MQILHSVRIVVGKEDLVALELKLVVEGEGVQWSSCARVRGGFAILVKVLYLLSPSVPALLIKLVTFAAIDEYFHSLLVQRGIPVTIDYTEFVVDVLDSSLDREEKPLSVT